MEIRNFDLDFVDWGLSTGRRTELHLIFRLMRLLRRSTPYGVELPGSWTIHDSGAHHISSHKTRPEIDMPVYNVEPATQYIVIMGLSIYLYSHVFQFSWDSKI